jgi:ABC-2 type transport system permease protein
MNKLLNHKYWWAFLIALIGAIVFVSSLFYKRLDITAEKRFSLTPTTKEILRNLKEPVYIDVFLKGNFPSGFKRLTNATKDFLEECNQYSKGKLKINFTNPLEGLEGEAEMRLKDSLQYLYDIPSLNVNGLQKEEGETTTQTNVLAGAIVRSGNRNFGVNLLRRAVLNTDDETETAALYEKIEATLENKFMDAIVKATNENVKTVGYAVGNGEVTEDDLSVADAINSLAPKSETSNTFKFGTVDLKQVPYIPDEIGTLIIMKPTEPFTDVDKLKIDQFVMHGGNVLWMVDNMYAEFDSLMQSQSFIAFDRGLNIDDLLFKYGVRINQNLLQDLNSDKLPLTAGSNETFMQNQLIKFSFFPILQGTNHSISKNLDGIRGLFPNTIDTITGNDIKKTILLTSSANAKVIGTPYKVDFSFMEYSDDKSKFTIKDTAVAVLLEGTFSSFFTNRLPASMNDSLNSYKRPFLEKGIKPGKMIVVADGDIAKNIVTKDGFPLLMGQNNYTKITYANKDFYLNCIEYLSGNEAILQTRNKDFTLRLLDPIKKENGATKWKIITTLIPIILLILFGVVYGFFRKRKYVK